MNKTVFRQHLKETK